MYKFISLDAHKPFATFIHSSNNYMYIAYTTIIYIYFKCETKTGIATDLWYFIYDLDAAEAFADSLKAAKEAEKYGKVNYVLPHTKQFKCMCSLSTLWFPSTTKTFWEFFGVKKL